MSVKYLHKLLLMLWMGAAAVCVSACSAGHVTTGSSFNANLPAPDDVVDSGMTSVPGQPGLSAGVRSVPDTSAEVPLPKGAARAGVDFASNRFIVIFNNAPSAGVCAQYLDRDATGTGSDIVRARDNAPLVQHAYMRRVSHNLAAKYGLTEYARVFCSSRPSILIKLTWSTLRGVPAV
jgi:hypothetical protein